MKLGLMQPYFLPYIGYFQLIAAVDKFVIYDDVNFIKGGWINRNYIFVNNKSNLFTVPLKNASSFSLINQVQINLNLFRPWKRKFLKTLELSYKKAPYFEDVFFLLNDIFDTGKSDLINDLAIESIRSVCNYLKLDTEINKSSVGYQNSDLRGQSRVLDICKQEGATQYINAAGGIKLYSKEDFSKEGILLQFLRPTLQTDFRFPANAAPVFSIIDLLMFHSPETVREFLKQYELL